MTAPSTFERPWMDHERCYRAVSSRDRRFDGWFVTAVRSTGIYCRPSCPARTPRRDGVEFLPTAAAAQQRGFRACKRCRPDAVPGSPAWDVRTDVVARAMRLIEDGVVDRDGVGGLASRLGYSSRHLARVLTDELGAGPLALARAQRAQTARILVETTSMPITEVAFAAGFSSIRQFNDTMQQVFDSSPSELRRRTTARPRPDSGAQTVTLRLSYRRPFAASELFDFLERRTVAGVEWAAAGRYRRSLRLPRGHGIVEVSSDRDHLVARVRLADVRDLASAVHRVRRLFDLDADPHAVDRTLGADPVLAGHVASCPGLRVPGSVDPTETVVRAVLGQQISVAGARTIAGRVVSACDRRLELEDSFLTHVFPDLCDVAALADADLPMPGARRRTLRSLAAAVADGTVVLDDACDRRDVERALLAIPGIGPWTAAYVRMRGLHDPDVFLAGDLGVHRALAGMGDTVSPESWRPWRSYATHHLWRTTAHDHLVARRPSRAKGVDRGPTHR